MNRPLEADAETVIRAAIAAADPAPAVRAALARARLDTREGVTLLAIGKAACRMAAAADAVLGGRVTRRAVVVPHGTLCDGALHASHPLPDVSGEAAARAVLHAIDDTPADAAVLVLLSGGASALVALPVPPVTIDEYAECVRLLLRVGADIAALNTVRRHIDPVKGGGLGLRTAPRATHVLVVSDVIGNDLPVIASGPFAPNPTTCADARAVLDRFGVAGECADSIRGVLARGAADVSAGVAEGDLRHVRHEIVLDNADALRAARDAASGLGYETIILAEPVTGEAHNAGRMLVGALRRRLAERTGDRPMCLIAGGETTVTVRGSGRGGRNHELALGAALDIHDNELFVIASAGTDGVDGTAGAAGAIASADVIARARAQGLDPAAFLRENDTFTLFDRLGACIRVGDTGTNVMDVQVLLAGRSRAAAG